MSLFNNSINISYNNKTKKTLPGAQAFLFCPRVNNKREAPPYICQRGSITVEASVILPLFVCFFSAMLFFFRIIQVQLVVQGALEETGRNLAILSVKELEETEADIGYLGVAKGMLYLKLKDEKAVAQYVSGGAVGVSLFTSDFEGDYISLNANYVMDFPIKILGKLDFLVCQKTRFRKWIGWYSLVESDAWGEWVYITEYGEVYHMRRSCPYLELSLQKIFLIELKTKRNLNGEIYEACERCEEGQSGGVVYITDYGDKYHWTLACGGLKRTIYQKKRSEVGGMEACTKCSK